jgi:DNA-binding SARP family transcriptional activator
VKNSKEQKSTAANISANHSNSESTKSLLGVYLFGQPYVEWAGNPLHIPRRQARALLYRLAIRPKAISRDHLCFLLWPDIPETSARRKLTILLTHLRRSLPEPEIVLTSGDLIQLNPDRVWSDTARFESLKSRAEFHHLTGTLQQIVDLYRGNFLTGFSMPGSPEYEHWAAQETHTFERRFLDALEALIDAYTAEQKYQKAIAQALRYLERDELEEGVHRRLINLYAQTGNRVGAQKQFERCIAILERELGVSPLPETEDAYRAALEGSSMKSDSRVPVSTLERLSTFEVPLMGREEVMQAMDQVFVRACKGSGGVILISGEPGIGKSRLMHTFSSRHQAQAFSLIGGANPGIQSIPYYPITQAIRTAFEVGPPALSVDLTWLSEASRLLPELGDMVPDLPPPMPLDSVEASPHLFEALQRLTMDLIPDKGALIICFDDLHWADGLTLEWLEYMGPWIRSNRLFVIGTYLEGERHALHALRHNLDRQGLLEEIDLPGLDIDGIHQILQHVCAGGTNNTLLTQRLKDVTGGNPFFLVETLIGFLEVGYPLEKISDVENLPLPETLRKAVRARLNHLTPMSRQVLEAGAVLGGTFNFEIVRETAGRGAMATVESLDELVTRRLLVDMNTGYRFNHELIQSIIYRDLSYWRRRLLHQRAGETLEKHHSVDWVTLARHFEQAESYGKAGKYTLQVGKSTKGIFAYKEAHQHFNHALDLLEREMALIEEPEAITENRRLRIQALAERGWVFRLLGDMEGYEKDLKEEVRLAAQLGDSGTLAHLRWREAFLHRWFCRYPQAFKAADEGVRLSQEIGDTCLEAKCLREAGMVRRVTGDLKQARRDLERAFRLFEEVEDVVFQIHSLSNLSTLHNILGEHQRAMELGRKSLALSNRPEMYYQRRLPLGDIGAAAIGLGDWEMARSYLNESLSIARQITDRTQEIWCLGHLGWLNVGVRQPGEALAFFQTALTLSEDINSHTEQSWLHSGLAEGYRLSGNSGRAMEHALRAMELASFHGQTIDEKRAQLILRILDK